MRYGYAGSIGSLVRALSKGQVTGRGAFDWGQAAGDGAHLTGGINLRRGVMVGRRTIAIEQHCY